MALRFLTPYTNLQNVDGLPISNAGGFFWYPNVGLIGGIDGRFNKITFDGVCAPLINGGGGNLGWSPIDQKYYNIQGRWLVQREVIGFIPTITNQPARYVAPGGNFVILPDRYLSAGFGNIFANNGVSTYTEFSFGGTMGNTGMMVGPGRNQNEIFVSHRQDGGPAVLSACFYDWYQKKVVSPVYKITTPGNSLAYCSDYNVLVQQTGLTLRLWSLESTPSLLSVPAVVAGQAKSGWVATYEVQVTGDYGDKVEGEIIDWTFTGSGTLLSSQSKTDEFGAARTKVAFGFTSIGSAVLTANLVD
jgi:hypothetical protein